MSWGLLSSVWFGLVKCDSGFFFFPLIRRLSKLNGRILIQSMILGEINFRDISLKTLQYLL